jgi:hypothetical protein
LLAGQGSSGARLNGAAPGRADPIAPGATPQAFFASSEKIARGAGVSAGATEAEAVAETEATAVGALVAATAGLRE